MHMDISDDRECSASDISSIIGTSYIETYIFTIQGPSAIPVATAVITRDLREYCGKFESAKERQQGEGERIHYSEMSQMDDCIVYMNLKYLVWL